MPQGFILRPIKIFGLQFVGCRGDANATATSCGSACRPTCADPDRANRACILLCLVNGCECKQGYILSESGVCVDPKDCPGK